MITSVLIGDGRGQTTTIEGVIASVVIIGTVLVVMNGAVTAPGTSPASTTTGSSGLSSDAQAVLQVSVNDGSLQRTLLNWDTGTGTFRNASQSAYSTPAEMPDRMSSHLSTVFHNEFNVNMRAVYIRGDGGMGSEQVLYQGEPAEGAVTVTETVVLYDDDVVTGGESRGEPVSTVDSFYIPESDSETHVYNVVRVEVTAWGVGA